MGAGSQRWWHALDRHEIECLAWLNREFDRLDRVVLNMTSRETAKMKPRLMKHIATLREIGTFDRFSVHYGPVVDTPRVYTVP